MAKAKQKAKAIVDASKKKVKQVKDEGKKTIKKVKEDGKKEVKTTVAQQLAKIQAAAGNAGGKRLE